MPSNYPDAFDTFPIPGQSNKLNDSSVQHSELHRDLGLSIEAVQSTLGIRPQGTEPTVVERFVKLQTTMNELLAQVNSVMEDFAELEQDFGETIGVVDDHLVDYNNLLSAHNTLDGRVDNAESDILDRVEKAGDIMTGQLIINVTNDLSATSEDHAFQIGPTSGINLAMDSNEIMVRNNGVVSTLHLQADGGSVTVGSNTSDATMTLNNKTVAVFENGSYAPTLTGMVVGTGGANVFQWVYVGGPNTGDRGIMNLHGVIAFGSSGQTFPTAPAIAMPDGFEIVSATTGRPIGLWQMQDSGTGSNNRVYPIFIGSTSTFRPLHGSFTSSPATLTTTTPITWAASDAMQIHVTTAVVRV